MGITRQFYRVGAANVQPMAAERRPAGQFRPLEGICGNWRHLGNAGHPTVPNHALTQASSISLKIENKQGGRLAWPSPGRVACSQDMQK
jgi:hypothetical protein